jgi:hypothetical protein
MLKYPIYWEDTGASIVPNNINKTLLTVMHAEDMSKTGVVSPLDFLTEDDIKGVRISTVSLQRETTISDVSILKDPTVIRVDETIYERVTAVVVPEVGFIFRTDIDIAFEDISNFTLSEIKEPNIRGVKYEWSDYTLRAVLEYIPVETNIFSKYTLVSNETEEVVCEITQRFPDGAIHSDVMYRVDSLYELERDIDNQKCIPMYLANKLFSEYKHVQNVLGVWDETNGVLIDDESLEFFDSVAAAGHKITIRCSGTEPLDIVDHYSMISTYKTGKPYTVSDSIRVELLKRSFVQRIDSDAVADAVQAFDDGDTEQASSIILHSIFRNVGGLGFDPSEGFAGIPVMAQTSPLIFGMQGPWKNP